MKSANNSYTITNEHAPTNDYNIKNPEEIDDFWTTMEETIRKIPAHRLKIILGDFNAKLGKEKSYRYTIKKHTPHKDTNKNGKHLIAFCKSHNLTIMSTKFKKPTRKLITWKFPAESKNHKSTTNSPERLTKRNFEYKHP